MRDRVNGSINYSRMESISLNGEVKLKIKEVSVKTRKTQYKRKKINAKSNQNEKDKTYVMHVLINLWKTVKL